MKESNYERVFQMKFSSVYPMYIKKVESKKRTKDELDEVIRWLTGYTQAGLQKQIDNQVDFQTFFSEAPKINPNAPQIKGVICGYRVEDITDPMAQKIRWLDKIIDELAKGKALEKIKR